MSLPHRREKEKRTLQQSKKEGASQTKLDDFSNTDSGEIVDSGQIVEWVGLPLVVIGIVILICYTLFFK